MRYYYAMALSPKAMEYTQLEIPLDLVTERSVKPCPMTAPVTAYATVTLSSGEAAALANARWLLHQISSHRLTKRVPGEIRKQARAILRGFPDYERLRAKNPYDQERVSQGVKPIYTLQGPGPGATFEDEALPW